MFLRDNQKMVLASVLVVAMDLEPSFEMFPVVLLHPIILTT